MDSYRGAPIWARTTHNKGSTCAFCAWALYTASRQRASSKSRRGERVEFYQTTSRLLYYEYVPVRSYPFATTYDLLIMMSALR